MSSLDSQRSTLCWISVSDPSLQYKHPSGEPWPRMNLNYHKWESLLYNELPRDAQKIYDASKKYLKAPLDDPTDYHLIDRFLLMNEKQMETLVAFLKGQMVQIRLESHKIYKQLQYCRALWTDARGRKRLRKNTWQEVKNRTAITENNGCVDINRDFSSHKAAYIGQFGQSLHHGLSNYVRTEQEWRHGLSKPVIEVMTHNMWMQIESKQRVRMPIIVVPELLCLLLGIRFTKPTQSVFTETDDMCPKLGTSQIFDPTQATALLSLEELREMINYNIRTSKQNFAFVNLQSTITNIVCFVFVLSLHNFCCMSFLAFLGWLCVKPEKQAKRITKNE